MNNHLSALRGTFGEINLSLLRIQDAIDQQTATLRNLTDEMPSLWGVEHGLHELVRVSTHVSWWNRLTRRFNMWWANRVNRHAFAEVDKLNKKQREELDEIAASNPRWN